MKDPPLNTPVPFSTTPKAFLLKGNTKAEVFVFLLWLLFSGSVYTDIWNNRVPCQEDAWWNVKCSVCVPPWSIWRGISILFETVVSLGFILWLSKWGSMFSETITATTAHSLVKPRITIKESHRWKRWRFPLMYSLTCFCLPAEF